jgi:hypothetical protein
MARGGIGFLLFQLPPVLHVRVVDDDFRTHFRELPHHDLRAAVAGIPHVLPVGGAQEGDLRGGDDLPHVPEGVPDELRHVEGGVSLMSIASGVILKMSSSKPMRVW